MLLLSGGGCLTCYPASHVWELYPVSHDDAWRRVVVVSVDVNEKEKLG